MVRQGNLLALSEHPTGTYRWASLAVRLANFVFRFSDFDVFTREMSVHEMRFMLLWKQWICHL